jgi:hypothetical protein
LRPRIARIGKQAPKSAPFIKEFNDFQMLTIISIIRHRDPQAKRRPEIETADFPTPPQHRPGTQLPPPLRPSRIQTLSPSSDPDRDPLIPPQVHNPIPRPTTLDNP